MTRHLICLALIALPAPAEKLTAQQVLNNVAAAYKHLSAVHMVAAREEITYPAGRAQTAFSECELAEAPGQRYLARLKQAQQQALAVSDGSDIWLALASKKQWSEVAADDDSEEQHDAKAASSGLHDSLQNILLNRFQAAAGTVEDPVLEKQEDFVLGGGKARCYVIRGHTGGSEIELLVDRQNFIVLRYKEKSKPPGAPFEVAVTLKALELNQEVSDSLFHFEPDPAWTQVETPVARSRNPIAPGERAADFKLKTLTGESVALENLHGSVVVIDFWATWCPPCIAEFPSIGKLRTEFGDAVRFYAVSDEPPATVTRFVEEHPIPMPALLDTSRDVHRHYGVHKIPALFVIDRAGVVRQQFTGMRNESELRQAIRSVLDPQPPGQ